jgi:60 kDa SS-A/Ro ribonucleoprotein
MSQFTLLTEKPLETTTSHEGGIVSKVNGKILLERFLILGSAGTFYASGGDVTKTMTTGVKQYIDEHPVEALMLTLKVAKERLALRKDPAIYVLALLSMPTVTESVRKYAYRELLTVCPTGTDLLHYMAFRYPEGPQGMRHSGMGFRKAIGRWFRDHPNLPLQAVKYEQRDGWSLRDVLRVARPQLLLDEQHETLSFIVNKEKWRARYTNEDDYNNTLFEGYDALRRESIDPDDAWRIIRISRLPREAIPGPLLAHRKVWEALLPDMPPRALIRNLGKLSSLDIDKDQEGQAFIIGKIQKGLGLLHPFEYLIGERMYSQGHGNKGKLTWKPNHFIIDALRQAYPMSYKGLTVHKGKPLVALDTSGSMTSVVSGTPLQALEAAAALASVIAYQYPYAEFFAYSQGLTRMDPKTHGAADFMAEMKRLQHVGTYCHLPLAHVMDHPEKEYTAVVSITDSETNDGGIVQPWRRSPFSGQSIPKCAQIVDAIQRTQRKDFKHAVVAMAANEVSIADPRDPNQLDLVGLSADLPVGLAKFLSGV